MRILFTNNTLSERAGTELYVRDLALAFIKQGHEISAYSRILGEVANELKSVGVEVVDNLNDLARPPDVLHGHHHPETMTALLRFPQTPAIFVSHGWVPWVEIPPRHPRILRYVAVDEPTRESAIRQHGIPEDRLSVVPNFVDLGRFRPRGPLPPAPKRALILSNYATEESHIPCVREACARAGIALDIRGWRAGQHVENPEEILPEYDLVFAKGRSALEAVAVGCAVIVCDAFGVGPLITMGNAMQLRSLKGDYLRFYSPLTVENVAKQIQNYNPSDAATVSSLARTVVGMDQVVAAYLKIYQQARDAFAAAPPDPEAEARAAADYLSWMSRHVKDLTQGVLDVEYLTQQLEITRVLLEREQNSLAYRMRHNVLRWPLIGRCLQKLAVKAKR